MKLSFILPIYNVEKYIENCLKSLLYQDISLEDYEIICIDDGSLDKSADIIKEYTRKYRNIKMIKKDNGGVSSARNSGLLLATGEYVWFIDSDDYIEANCVGFILESIQNQNADVLTIQMNEVLEESTFLPKIFQRKESTNKIYTVNSPVLFICKRDMLVNNKIIFNTSLAFAEDTLWVYFVKKYANKIAYTQTVIYHYRQNPNSVMHQKGETKYIRVRDDMIRLAKIYQQEKVACSNSKEEKHLNDRQSLAVQGALVQIFLYEKNICTMQDMLINLQNQGLYPYSTLWFNIKPNTGIIHTLINWITLFFPLRWYFITCYKLMRLFKKMKKMK